MHICPECQGPLKFNNYVLASIPPQYQHKCMVCDHLVNIRPEEPALPRFISALESHVQHLKRGDIESAMGTQKLMDSLRQRMNRDDHRVANEMFNACAHGFKHVFPGRRFRMTSDEE